MRLAALALPAMLLAAGADDTFQLSWADSRGGPDQIWHATATLESE